MTVRDLRSYAVLFHLCVKLEFAKLIKVWFMLMAYECVAQSIFNSRSFTIVYCPVRLGLH